MFFLKFQTDQSCICSGKSRGRWFSVHILLDYSWTEFLENALLLNAVPGGFCFRFSLVCSFSASWMGRGRSFIDIHLKQCKLIDDFLSLYFEIMQELPRLHCIIFPVLMIFQILRRIIIRPFANNERE